MCKAVAGTGVKQETAQAVGVKGDTIKWLASVCVDSGTANIEVKRWGFPETPSEGNFILENVMTDQQCIENAMNAHAHYAQLCLAAWHRGDITKRDHYQRVADAFLAAADEIERNAEA